MSEDDICIVLLRNLLDSWENVIVVISGDREDNQFKFDGSVAHALKEETSTRNVGFIHTSKVLFSRNCSKEKKDDISIWICRSNSRGRFGNRRGNKEICWKFHRKGKTKKKCKLYKDSKEEQKETTIMLRKDCEKDVGIHLISSCYSIIIKEA